MKFISRQTKAAGAAKAWIKQYGTDRDGVANRIESLGDKPDPDAVNKIIGNDSWTCIKCDECGQDVDFVVECGQEPGYESSTARLCGECVRKAMAIVLTEDAK